jgi:hypothetical protein
LHFSCLISLRYSSIGSTVFVDLNDNGLYEPAKQEFGYNGLLVILFLGNGTILSQTTNSTGNYLFGGLHPGNYRYILDYNND